MLIIMKKYFMLTVVLLLAVTTAHPAFADIRLPEPQTEGGIGLFEALKKRASAPGGDFPSAPLSDEELSNALWAATGLNRGETGWTVPMDRGVPPYVDVYAALESGVYLYDWREHSLVEITAKDIRPVIGLQKFVANTPCALILVANAESLSVFGDETLRTQFADVAAGAMTQDVYLAAASMNLGARYIHSLNADEIKSALSLPEGDRVICLMMLGK
jgi:nitroreductase